MAFGSQPISAAALTANQQSYQQALQTAAKPTGTSILQGSAPTTGSGQSSGPLPAMALITAVSTQLLGVQDPSTCAGVNVQSLVDQVSQWRSSGQSDSQIAENLITFFQNGPEYSHVAQNTATQSIQLAATQAYTQVFGQPPDAATLAHFISVGQYVWGSNTKSQADMVGYFIGDMTTSGGQDSAQFIAAQQNQQLSVSSNQQNAATGLVNNLLGVPTNTGGGTGSAPSNPYGSLFGTSYGQGAMYATSTPYYASTSDPLASLSQFFPTTYSGGGGSYGGSTPSSLPYSFNMPTPNYSQLFSQASTSMAQMQQQLAQQQSFMSNMFGGGNNLNSFISGTTQGFGSLGLQLPSSLSMNFGGMTF